MQTAGVAQQKSGSAQPLQKMDVLEMRLKEVMMDWELAVWSAAITLHESR